MLVVLAVMTAVERSRRRQARSIFRRRLPTKFLDNRLRSLLDRQRALLQGYLSSTIMLQVNHVTTAAMRLVVESLLAEGPTTAGQLAEALRGASSVQTAFAEDLAQDVTPRWSWQRLTRPRQRTDRRTQRRYQYMAAVDRLPTSNVEITDWAMAEQYLSGVFEFPPPLMTTTAVKLPKEEDPTDLEDYTRRLRDIRLSSLHQGLTPSQKQYQAVVHAKTSGYEPDQVDEQLLQRLSVEYQEREERLKSPALERVDRELQEREREEEARQRASELMRDLTEEEQALVQRVLYEIGPGDEVLAQTGTDTIQRVSIQRLRPRQWLNDEVIHYFYVMLQIRDEQLCAEQPGRRRSHFFKSFFMTKLLNIGHATMNGKYEYKNVKRWSKKVPGKDIFELDKIIFPINVSEMHWTCAVIFMQEKRIQFYDSLGDPGRDYLEHLFRYVQDEHMDKKKKPLPDADQWEMVECTSSTPRQLNGFDCGVFTCMFADFLSKDCPLVFDQSHITQCRERIALSIMKGVAVV